MTILLEYRDSLNSAHAVFQYVFLPGFTVDEGPTEHLNNLIKTYHRYCHFWIKGFLKSPCPWQSLFWPHQISLDMHAQLSLNTAERDWSDIVTLWLHLNSVWNCWCSFIREKSSITLEFHSEWVSHSTNQGTSVIAEFSANSRATWVCASYSTVLSADGSTHRNGWQRWKN